MATLILASVTALVAPELADWNQPRHSSEYLVFNFSIDRFLHTTQIGFCEKDHRQDRHVSYHGRLSSHDRCEVIRALAESDGISALHAGEFRKPL